MINIYLNVFFNLKNTKLYSLHETKNQIHVNFTFNKECYFKHEFEKDNTNPMRQTSVPIYLYIFKCKQDSLP